MPPAFTIEPLGSHHDGAAFSCGNASLDDFIKTKARREGELGYCAVFILADENSPTTIVGYYTLSAHSIALESIPADRQKKLPRYPGVPVTLIGRLARDIRFRGQGVGELLIIDALKRARDISTQVGSYAVTVDAIGNDAVAFYSKYSFLPLTEHANRLFLPMATVKKLGI